MRCARRRRQVRAVPTALLVVAVLVAAALQVAAPASAGQGYVPVPHIPARVAAAVSRQVSHAGLTVGQPVFLRIFKLERRLEVFLQAEDGAYRLFRRYSICALSGGLGPKLVEGDLQAPEGVYTLTLDRLNPWSKYHLSMNLGYPNRLDQALGRTGALLMIHGDCVSEGCFAMTDPNIEQVYYLVAAALYRGQAEVPVHIFPFVPTAENFDPYLLSPWFHFWWSLKKGYDLFERHKRPPQVSVDLDAKVYRFSP